MVIERPASAFWHAHAVVESKSAAGRDPNHTAQVGERRERASDLHNRAPRPKHTRLATSPRGVCAFYRNSVLRTNVFGRKAETNIGIPIDL
jgi:hypothetical protein